MVSEVPSLTNNRFKTFLSGVLAMALELKEPLSEGKFTEDNLLNQLHQKLGSEVQIHIEGEPDWPMMFGEWFTKSKDSPCILYPYDDRDDIDACVHAGAIKELENGSAFDFMLLHRTSVDYCGHTYSSYDPELTRYLLEYEKNIEEMIEKMDDNTTLVVFGDHGMTYTGSHGGGTELEMRTTFFAYQKTPFG